MTKISTNFEEYKRVIGLFKPHIRNWEANNINFSMPIFYFIIKDQNYSHFLAVRITFARILMNKNYKFDKYDL